jgi:hypothetical protein
MSVRFWPSVALSERTFVLRRDSATTSAFNFEN